MTKPIYLFSFVLFFFSCQSIELPSDILMLDQDFIAVWLPAQKCDMQQAGTNYSKLHDQFYFFKNKYSDLIKNANAKEEVRLLEQWLLEAKECLELGDDICVKVKLDQFKFQLQEIRIHWEADYFLDYLWNFEEELNSFIAIGTDPKLDLLEWNEFLTYLMTLNTSFQQLQEKELDPEFLDFDPDRLEKWAELKERLASKLTCLNGLTEGAQKEEIVHCAIGVQETTFEAIALFGNISYTPTIIY